MVRAPWPPTDCAARAGEPPSCHRAPGKDVAAAASALPLLRHGDEVLLVKRPAPGIWGGLWCLPEISDDESSLPAVLRERFGVKSTGEVRQLPDIVHTFTHFRLTLAIT